MAAAKTAAPMTAATAKTTVDSINPAIAGLTTDKAIQNIVERAIAKVWG